MASSVIESKCFICSTSFDAKLLPQHERECLMNLQDNLENITKEVDGLLETDIESVQSATSTGSSEGSSRKTVRCYICGNDFSTHFIAVHEKQCKRKWDSGVAKHEKLKKVSSVGTIFSCEDKAGDLDKNSKNMNGLRKAQSVANVSNREPKQAWNARLRNDVNATSVPKSSPRVKKGLKGKPRPASAYASLSTQDLSTSFASSNEVSIFDDTLTLADLMMDSNKAVSTNDLSQPEKETTRRSKFNPCKFCSKIFSIHSIAIHEKKCRERGQKENSSKLEPSLNGLSASVHDVRNENDNDDLLKNKTLANTNAFSVDKLNLIEMYDANIASVAGPFQSPRFLPCHVCGKPFGSKSLRIHIPQCEKKWERENKSNSVEKTRLPRKNHPRRLFHSETNLVSKYEDNNLKPSIWYGNRLSHHTPLSVRNGLEKKGTLENREVTIAFREKKAESKPIVISEPRSTSKRPTSGVGNYVACQFCNNYYGSASVKIHESKCGTKFGKERDDSAHKNPIKASRKLNNASARRLFGPRR